MSNVALLHYWLVNMRGGEKVVQALASMYPNADIFTHVVAPEALPSELASRNIRTTFIQHLPQAKRRYQSYLPFMPLALEQLDLRKYDLVISSESGPAKGVLTSPTATHVCYCHSPMRYIWDMYHDYLEKSSLPVRLLMRPLCHYLRIWDFASAQRVDHFIANSRFVAERIRKCYRRDATVIPPPVDVMAFSPNSEKDDFYLFFGELVGYKRADLAIEAFRASGRKLIIAGKGEQLETLRRRAPENVQFTGSLPFGEVQKLLARARALVFPGVEDFGIVPVEAMASGTPVIAYSKGGILDSVIPEKTGLFFDQQTPDALNEALERFEAGIPGISTTSLREQAMKFLPEHFSERFTQVVKEEIEQKRLRLGQLS